MRTFSPCTASLPPATPDMENRVHQAVDSFFQGLEEVLAEETPYTTLDFTKDFDAHQWLGTETQWVN